MNYFDVDYYTLIALERMGTTDAETLLREMARELGWMSCADLLASSLSALEADGYVAVNPPGGMLSADTSATLTDKGKAAIAVGGMALLFSGMRQKAIRKNEKSFCDQSRPSVEPFPIDRASFAAYAERMEQDREAAFLMVDNAEDGLYTLSLQRPYYQEQDSEEADTDELTVLCDLEGLRRMLGDLLDTALCFTETRRARKILISGPGRAYVLTFCEVADEAGYTVMRVSAAPVLFNRQRFLGKRDSELDYAQCGDVVLSVTLDSADELCGIILGTVCRRVDLLDETLGGKIHELYKKIR